MKDFITRILFIIYFVFLVWAVLFKLKTYLPIQTYRRLELTPFNYGETISGNYPQFESILNVLIFVPFGFLLSKITQKNFFKKLLIIFFVSLCFEIIQYCLAIGVADVTDLITNTSGGLIGILLAKIL